MQTDRQTDRNEVEGPAAQSTRQGPSELKSSELQRERTQTDRQTESLHPSGYFSTVSEQQTEVSIQHKSNYSRVLSKGDPSRKLSTPKSRTARGTLLRN